MSEEELKAYYIKKKESDVLKQDGQLLYKQGVIDGYDKAIYDFVEKATEEQLRYDCPLDMHDVEKIAEKLKQVEQMPRMSRMSKDEYYLNIAKAVAQRSTCLKRRYGCVIVKDDEIISTGYNGSPRGFTNCCDTDKCDRMDKPHNSGDYSDCCSVHAEQNAIISASRSEMLGATMYLAGEEYVPDDAKVCCWDDDWQEIKDCAPCPICARMILNCGLRVVNRIGTLKIEKFAHKERT